MGVTWNRVFQGFGVSKRTLKPREKRATKAIRLKGINLLPSVKVARIRDTTFPLQRRSLLPIPLDEDIIILGGAIGTFVAWPVHLVDVVLTKRKVIAERNATSPPE
ncbi:hypothetical protein Lal_00017032 [Lupinus albus]|nr:hypothetical protein Lal_00017032 [Lupinus albus]